MYRGCRMVIEFETCNKDTYQGRVSVKKNRMGIMEKEYQHRHWRLHHSIKSRGSQITQKWTLALMPTWLSQGEERANCLPTQHGFQAKFASFHRHLGSTRAWVQLWTPSYTRQDTLLQCPLLCYPTKDSHGRERCDPQCCLSFGESSGPAPEHIGESTVTLKSKDSTRRLAPSSPTCHLSHN